MAQRQGLREVVQQKSDEFGVQFHAGEAGEVIAGTPNAPRPLIGAGRKQGVKDIGDRDQLRMGMDLIPAQAQVAAAVQALMVLERHGGGGAHGAVGMDQDMGADGSVHAHDCMLLLSQRPGLAEDGGRDGRLADVVDKGGLGNCPHLGVR